MGIFLAGDNPSKYNDLFLKNGFYLVEGASWSVSGSDLTNQGVDDDDTEEEEVNLAPDGGK
jgi:hypothetical protein